MAKVQGPFLSQTASGSVGNALTARRVNGAAVMSMKRVRGTKFPQSRPESVPAVRWWNRGNAFKVSAAYLPVLETTKWGVALDDKDNVDITWPEAVDYLVAQGDAQLQLKSSRSRRGFYIAQSVINLISLELDRAEEFFPQIDAQIEEWLTNDSDFDFSEFPTRPARQYVDAFFGPRDLPPNILHYLWSRVFLDWFAARLPFAFFQASIFVPGIPAPRLQIIAPFIIRSEKKQQGGAVAASRRATPPPPLPVQTHADLQAALAERARIQQSA